MEKEELLETAKPILFNTDMVSAILDGRKSSTRRVVKFLPGENPHWTGYIKDGLMLYNGRNEPCCRKPAYQSEDILYVRETFKYYEKVEGRGESCHRVKRLRFKADSNNNEPSEFYGVSWKPPIHMQKEDARIFLKVTDVRLEKLHAITNEQILREGAREEVINSYISRMPEISDKLIREAYMREWKHIWDSSVNKANLYFYGFGANPWVWVIEFERIG